MVLDLLKEIHGLKLNKPQGAFYIFPDVRQFFGMKTETGNIINNANDLAMHVLESAHVAIVAGNAFGADDCIRISYAASDEELIEACKRLKKCLNHEERIILNQPLNPCRAYIETAYLQKYHLQKELTPLLLADR